MSMDIKQYLLPVGRADSMEKKIRVINKTFVTPPVNIIEGVYYECLTCEYKRVLYILQHVGSVVRLQKLNLMNNQLTWLHDFECSISFNNQYLGGIIVDDSYMYALGANANTQLYVIDLKTFNVSTYTASGYMYARGKLEWFDNKTLIMQYKNGGYALFDTVSRSFQYVTSQNSNSYRGDFAYGCGYVLSTYYSDTSTIYVHQFTDNTYFTITLETSAASKVYFCKDNNLFYITQKAKLYTWDPSTKTLSPSTVMPWSTPGSLIVEDGVVYVTQSNSNIAYIYDISKDKYWRNILPFDCCNTTTSSSISTMYRPSAFRGYWFIPNNVLYQIHYAKNDKYKIGNKYDRTLFLFDESQKDSFEYDDRFISFDSTHLTIHDGVIHKQLTRVSDDSPIKSVSINKNEYNKLKQLKLLD